MKPGRASLARLVSLVVLLAGCSPAGSPGPATETPPRPTNPFVAQDGALRPVRMTSGRALTYVQPETGSQILCQTIGRDRWERLLDSRVGLHPAAPPDAACMIASDWGGVNLSLRRSDEAFVAETTIAGRPASSTEGSAGNVVTRVALTDDALRPASRQYRPTRHLLELQVIHGNRMDAETQRHRAMRVLTELVPPLAKDGDPIPDINEQGYVHYVSTPLTGGGQIVDLPRPVQALQLCTLMREAPAVGVVVTRMDVHETARCEVRTEGGGLIVIAMEHTREAISDYSANIAGRPARGFEGKSMVVRLRDDAQVDLSVSAADSAAIAEKLVPLLLA